MSDIQNSKNILSNAQIDVNGNVIVGDGNTIINLKEAAEYKALEAEIQSLNEDFERTRAKVDQYPDDDDFKQNLLRIDARRSQKEKDLATLKQEVLKLAEEFTRIPLNTERLRRAKEHFDKGEFKEARAILDAEKMAPELDAAIQKEALGQKLQEQAKAERANLANEYLILARLTAIDFDLPDRFEQTKIYFEESLRAERNAENTFAYAYFLQEHNQYQEAPLLYEEALQIYRSLAELNPQTFLPHVATTLNNLGILHRDTNELLQAEAEYTESLQIYRALAESNPQRYMPDVALALNNLGILHRDTNELLQAEAEYTESLQIRRALANSNPEHYLPYVAGTLNNLAVLHNVRNELLQAEAEYTESLKIRRGLAKSDPQRYFSDVAGTLNNLAILHRAKNELLQAEAEHEEALKIRSVLAKSNPQRYLPDVATTLNNLANIHSAKNELLQAKAGYNEALKIRRALAKDNPQIYLPYVANTLNNLAALCSVKNELFQAEANYTESLKIYRELAEVNPESYLVYVAGTLNNLAVLHCAKKEFLKVEDKYAESLEIYQALANSNPQSYLPDVAMISVNMGGFYLENIPDKEKSIGYCKEALRAALPFAEFLPAVAKYAKDAIQILKAWGEDVEATLRQLEKEQQVL